MTQTGTNTRTQTKTSSSTRTESSTSTSSNTGTQTSTQTPTKTPTRTPTTTPTKTSTSTPTPTTTPTSTVSETSSKTTTPTTTLILTLSPTSTSTPTSTSSSTSTSSVSSTNTPTSSPSPSQTSQVDSNNENGEDGVTNDEDNASLGTDVIPVTVNLPPGSSSTETQSISLSNGEKSIGQLLVPDSILGDSGSLTVGTVDLSTIPTDDVGSTVIDITLIDGNGFIQTSLDTDIELCLSTNENEEIEDLCLGYLDESINPPEWTCEDQCLEKDGDFVCGTSDHLTSFAVLLDSGSGSGGCGNNEDNKLYIYLSVAAIVIALLCIIFVVVSFDIKKRYEKFQYKKENKRRLIRAESSLSHRV
eukprot:TRINITY_DN1205_c1_g1_i8.p1 TRINITY_DN1205_c1_g1~~TRINITY_DN1205_c1_g1_i8.p1  ORF type:complete len:360 (+),score=137.03 TRINITY_DN1205_c1_g1_i8:1404-2483(+)